MDPMLLLLFGLMFASLFLGLLAIAKPKQREDVESRLKRLSQNADRPVYRAPEAVAEAPPARKDAVADANAQLDELFRPWADSRVTEGQAAELTRVLQAAGRYGMTPLQLRVWQLKCAVLMPIGAAVFTFALIGFNPAVLALVALAGTVGGFFYPILALQREGVRRRDTILKQLPTTLDLLTVCVEAGLSLQAGMQKVVEKTRPSPLREEIDQVLREIQLGRPRGDALKEMARRVGLKEVNSVVLAMVQAEAMGTGVAKNLRIQSEIARDNRMQRAQEQAMQAPVKLSFPLVFFIFPVVFIVIFGPVALELFTNWVGQ
ncbi:MAG: type II secretion system F family protein [Candidatus Sericytochromatia bacterium]|nr:type II secretion system F family protein [Candidatus Sericytochromatia bacterium]